MATQEAKNQSRAVRPINETKPPKALFKLVMNPIMHRVLRSPKSKVGEMILLITFTGRKSGKQFTTPIGYRKIDENTLVLYTDSPWYKNLVGGAPVTLTVKGKEMKGWAEATDDKDLIVKETARHLRSRGLEGAREIGIMRLKSMPTEDDLRVMLQDRAKITIKLGETQGKRR